MEKAALRTHFLTLRRALSADAVRDRSAAIADQFFRAFFGSSTSVSCVHVFLPITRQNEVNTWPIVHRIWQDFPSVRLVVSITEPNTGLLIHTRLTPETPLIQNRWGIPEPASASATVSPTELDLVLVPLLIFDESGHRVGYGGGYYDRFLAECRSDCARVGLSLFEPVTTIDDITDTDISLTACLSPQKLYTF